MTANTSPLAPFRRRTFAVLWFAALLGNTGTWLRDVANGWTMTELSPSPVMVALVQAAMTLPVFLFSLPAGAISDIVDRRGLLIAIQLLLITVSLCLASAASFGFMSPGLLLGLTFAGGVGLAFMGPPWQAIVPELVPRSELRAAVALNSLGINVARAIGPALGGFVLATSGAALAYLLDASSYVVVIGALLFWRRTWTPDPLRERLLPAISTGVRYVLLSSDVKRTLFRAAAFFLFASAYWALLPLVARQSLGGDATLYGVLLGSVGAGAITGALLLPRLARGVSPNIVVFAGTLLTAGAMVMLGAIFSAAAAAGALFLAGMAWIAVLTTLNVTAQSILPDWVRARGLAVYLTVFFGAMALGSYAWGQAAAFIGVPGALLVAAGGATLVGIAALLVRLPTGEDDLTPHGGWLAPEQTPADTQAAGPVTVQIRYRIPPHGQAEFLDLVTRLGILRRRDGVQKWRVEQDGEDPQLFIETFVSKSWQDHMRQHAHFTKADASLQAHVNALHADDDPPTVRHILSPPG